MSQLALSALAALLAVGSPSDPDPASERMLNDSHVDKIAKKIQDYWGYLDEEDHSKANREFQKVEDEVASVAKSIKIEEPLRLVEDWREILRRGSLTKKPLAISATDSFGLRPIELEGLPVDTGAASSKDLQGAFDETLKVFVSVPRASRKEPVPVILALHPVEDESAKKLSDMETSHEMTRRLQDWASDTYPKEVTEKAIVVVPILDLVVLDASGMTGNRPRWDTTEGARWAYRALRDIVFLSLPHDPARIFIDGHGVGAAAAMIFCSRLPGTQAGAIIRGPAPDQVKFHNCRSSAFLFVGPDTKEFYERWREEQGFRLHHAEELDAATLVSFLESNPKTFCPDKVEIRTDNLAYASSYWLRINDFDWQLESKEDARAMGEVDREANAITVTTNARVKSFSIYLNDQLLDLDQEVKVYHKLASEDEDSDAKPELRWAGIKKRLLSDTLQHAYTNTHGNKGEVYVSDIRVDLF